MILTAGTKRKHVLSFRDASHVYSAWRGQRRKFPEGMILDGVEVVARVSYNGRVWAPGEWKAGDVPLYDYREVVA